MMYEKKTTLRPYRLISFSVGAVLIYQFCPGFGTEASAPVVLWFHGTRPGTLVLVLTSRYQGFGQGINNLSRMEE